VDSETNTEMGDASLTAEAMALSSGVGAFYMHWLTQVMDPQNSFNRSMPNFVASLGTTKWGTELANCLCHDHLGHVDPRWCSMDTLSPP
jgi:hypothetical protein